MNTASMASASPGPTPLASAAARRCSARPRGEAETGSASLPAPAGRSHPGTLPGAASRRGCRACTARAARTPPTSMTAPSARDRADHAVQWAITRAPPRAAPPAARPPCRAAATCRAPPLLGRCRLPGCGHLRAVVAAVARRRCAAAAPRWQIARASASAESAGRGRIVHPEQPRHHHRHLLLICPALRSPPLDLARRVQRDRRPAARRAHDGDGAGAAPCPSPSGRCAG